MTKHAIWFLLAISAAAQSIDPRTQLNWPRVSGTGAPTLNSFAADCGTKYGEPYTDKDGPHQWVCTTSGWFQIDSTGGGSVTDFKHNGTLLTGSFATNPQLYDYDETLTPDAGYMAAKGNFDTVTGKWFVEVPSTSNTLKTQIIPPVAGQYVVLYPHVFTPGPSSGGATIAGDTTGATLFAPTQCSLSEGTSGVWSGYTLADYGISAGAVTSVYAASVSSLSGGSSGRLCFGSPAPFLFAPGGVTGPSSVSISPSVSFSPWLLQQVTAVTGVTGSGIATATTSAALGTSSQTQIQTTLVTAAPVLIVYYTGSPVTSPVFLNIAPPLQYDGSTNTLGVDPTYPRQLNAYYIASMPTAAYSFGRIVAVIDSTDCITSTGAVNYTLCKPVASGTSYVWAPVSGGSGSLSLTTTGTSGASTLSGSTLNIPQYQGAITLTTTGTSGAATLIGTTLNIPQYSGGGGGGLSGQTTNYLPKATSSTASTVSSIIEDVGTGVNIHGTGTTNAAFFPASGGTPTPVATDAGLGADSSGNLVGSDNGGAFSRVCTAANGQCAGSSFITSLTTTGSSGASTVSGGVLNIPVYSGGSGGVQYGTITTHYVIGGSYGVVSTINTKLTDSATPPTCNGTTCTVTTSTAHGYTNGQKVNLAGNVATYPIWSPSCLNFSIVTIVSHTSTTFTFNESDGHVPGHTGCTGSQTGSSGTQFFIQDATYFYPSLLSSEPFFTNNGTITPTIYNWNWPGEGVLDWDTNFSSYSAGVTGPAIIWNNLGGNDIAACTSAALIQAAFSSVWTKTHALTGTPKVYQSLIPPGFAQGSPTNYNTYDTTFCPTANATWATVNSWLPTQQCSILPAGTTACADQVFDDSVYMRNTLDAQYIQQSGLFVGHPTNNGAAALANAHNQALVPQATSAGQQQPSLGRNTYSDQQIAPGFNVDAFGVVDNGGYAIIPGLISYYHIGQNYDVYRANALNCYSNNGTAPIYTQNATGCIGADFNNSGFLQIQAGGSAPTWGTVFDGGIHLQDILMGTTAPTTGAACSPDGDIRFTADGLVKQCSTSTHLWVVPSWAGGLSNPMTTLGDTMYGGSAGAVTRLAGPTTTAHQFLLGDVPVSSAAVAPAWFDLGANLGTYVKATSPIVATQNANDVTLSCPTCGTSSSTAVNNNGGSTLGTSQQDGMLPYICADSSGSGTAQSCNTATSFTVTSGNCFVYKTTTTNSGTGLTLNPNSLGAKSVAIPGSSGWTTTLTASAIPANKPMTMCYDGTNLNLMETGTVSTGGSGALTNITSTLTPSGCTTTSGQCVVGTPGTTISFSSIPGTYRALQIVVTAATSNSSASDMWMQFNGDTGANYSRQYTFTTGSATPSAGQTLSNANAGIAFIGSNSAFSGNSTSTAINIDLYAGTTFKKYASCLHATVNGASVSNLGQQQSTLFWNSTAAITSFTLGLASGNFVAGSSISVYGIQ